MTLLRALLLAGLATLPAAARSPRPVPILRLELPIACRLGETCAVQSYMNDGSNAAPRDYLCRWRTYPGHNGTDFRIQSLALMRTGVPVLASAPGRVLRVRDGVPDVSVRERGSAAVKDEECGNGLVIAHGGGWETQYCHLRQGSLRERPGAHVHAGQAIGLVGLSGDTEFPHVHITVRKDGRVVDPFAYGAAPGQCGGGQALWRQPIPYQSGQPFVVGFATKAVEMGEAQASGPDQAPRPTRNGPALVAFVQAIGLKQGDIQRLALIGPDARVLVAQDAPPLDHDKAQTIYSVGRRTPPAGWAPGVYQASYAVRRDGADVLNRTFRIIL